MSFETPTNNSKKEKSEVTKVETKKTRKKPQEVIAFEETQIEEGPIETAETVSYREEKGTKPKERITVEAKSEKEKFFERLRKYDEDEDEEKIIRVKADIAGKPRKEVPFLEKKVSEEVKQQRFLENLTITLKEIAPRDIDRDDLEKLLSEKTDINFKIKKLLNLSQADKIDSIENRERAFNTILDFLEPKFKAEKRKIFTEVGEANISDEKRLKLYDKKMNELNKEYGFDELFKYLDLGTDKGGSFDLQG